MFFGLPGWCYFRVGPNGYRTITDYRFLYENIKMWTLYSVNYLLCF